VEAAPVAEERVEEAKPASLEDVLQTKSYSDLVELHDLVADSPYSGRRGKTRIVAAVLELDEGDILAALE
jgi:hypothetical protein